MIDTQAIRSKILDLAMRGQLTEQLPKDGTADDFLSTFKTKSKKITSISIDDLFFDIPQNWKWCRFSELVDFSLGKTPARKEKQYWIQGKYPWVTISDISSDFLVSTHESISQKAADECFPNGITPKGTLIMSFKLTIGKVAVLGIDAFHNEAIISIFPRNDVNNIFRDYLMKILPYSANQGNIYGAIKGNTLNKKSLADLLIPLPPIKEQNRIIEKIDQAFSVLDTIDELQARYADNLTALKSKLIDAAIQGKLTEQLPEDGTAEELYQQIQEEKQKLIKEGKIKKQKPLPEISDEEIPFDIPENWKWVRMNEITSKVTSGSTPKGGKKSNAYVSNGFPFFREQNIYNDGIHTDGMVYISNDLLCTRLNSTVIAKDILLNITGGSIGRCALIPDDFDRGSINQHILILRMVKPEIRFYIHKLMCSSYVQNYIKNKSVGDKDGFSGGRCKQMLIPFPPLAEQKRIVQKLEEILPLCEKLK